MTQVLCGVPHLSRATRCLEVRSRVKDVSFFLKKYKAAIVLQGWDNISL